MKRIFFITALVLCWHTNLAQNIWTFGFKMGIDFSSGNPVFTLPPPKIYAIDGGTASVCDAAGQLLFYTEGSRIWDRAHNLMPNGLLFPQGCNNITFGTTQAAVIVPMPDSSHKYYVFSLEQFLSDCIYGSFGSKGRLWYSIVDMNLNNGFGDVVPGKKTIVIDSFLADKMAPVLGDKCNIWLMTKNRRNNDWKAFEINETGINFTPVISTVGNFASYTTWSSPTDTINFPYFWSAIKFSPTRRKMAVGCIDMFQRRLPHTNGLELYDFDPATGLLSNPIELDTSHEYRFNCFSPDGSKLYGTAPGYTTMTNDSAGIFQWDLSLPSVNAIVASKTWVGQTQPLINSPTDMKVAPNGKIYMFRFAASSTLPTTNRYLHSIEYPNLAGTACQFIFNSVLLLPNPNWLTPNPATDGVAGGYTLPNEVVYLRRDTINSNGYIEAKACFRDSVLLSANPAGRDYVWEDGHIGPDRYAYTNGLYVVHYYTPPCTYHSDTFKAELHNELPLLGTGGNDCSRKIAWIGRQLGDTATYTFTWYDAQGNVLHTTSNSTSDTLYPPAPGPYSVSFTNSFGCDSSFEFILQESIKASFVNDTALCADGSLVTFVNQSSGNINACYWSFGDNSFSTDFSPSHLYGPGFYTVQLVVADTSVPCYDTAYGHVRLDSIPYLYVVTEGDSVCEGNTVTFYVNYLAGADSLMWNLGDGFGWSNVFPNQNTLHHTFDTSGQLIFTTVGKYPHCPDVMFTDTVVIFPYPTLDLGRDTFMCPNGQPITIGDYANDANPLASWAWNTGASEAFIAVRHPGIYTAKVTVNGCATNDSIEVFKDCYIDIPNVFTPNGDGLNDYFLPRQLLSRGLTAFRMQIFSRWGQLIYETDRIDGRGWDGRFNNVEQPQGVFVYLIEATFKSGAKENYKGNVTLIR